MNYEELLKQYKKKLICSPENLTEQLSYKQDKIKMIIPHREPFLLIDEITGVDLTHEIIAGARTISEDDQIFKGHFPGFPVYPGSLQLEMIGQLGLCLHHFLINKTIGIQEQNKSFTIRATKIIGAVFTEPLLPGTKAIIIAKKLFYDSFFGTIIGQVVSHQKVCSVCISEVCYLE